MLLTTAPDNAFDVPLSVFAEFSGASAAAGARRRVSPFYFQNFSRSYLANGSEVLTPNGEPQFLVRFTAAQPGRYTYELHGATAMDGRTTSGSVQVVLSHTHARARARSLARSRSLTVALTVSLRCPRQAGRSDSRLSRPAASIFAPARARPCSCLERT